MHLPLYTGIMLLANQLQNSFKITCTDHRIIEILGLRPSNKLPVSYYGTKSQLW
jgi:hypothetical protein